IRQRKTQGSSRSRKRRLPGLGCVSGRTRTARRSFLQRYFSSQRSGRARPCRNSATAVVLNSRIAAIVTAFERTEQTLATLSVIQKCEPQPAEILVHVDGKDRKSTRLNS